MQQFFLSKTIAIQACKAHCSLLSRNFELFFARRPWLKCLSYFHFVITPCFYHKFPTCKVITTSPLYVKTIPSFIPQRFCWLKFPQDPTNFSLVCGLARIEIEIYFYLMSFYYIVSGHTVCTFGILLKSFMVEELGKYIQFFILFDIQ